MLHAANEKSLKNFLEQVVIPFSFKIAGKTSYGCEVVTVSYPPSFQGALMLVHLFERILSRSLPLVV